MDLMTNLRDSLCDAIQMAVEDVIDSFNDELEHNSKENFQPLLDYVEELDKEKWLYTTSSNRTVRTVTDDLVRLKREILDD